MPDRSDRPTLPPSFDVAKYAKESDAKVATARAIEADEAPRSAPQVQQSEMRLLTRPTMGAATTDEGWARSIDRGPGRRS